MFYHETVNDDPQTDDKIYTLAEMKSENSSWFKRLIETKQDKYVIYSAASHFIYKNSPIPLVASDRFSIELGLDSSRMLCKASRAQDI